jgi:hypothetical protein
MRPYWVFAAVALLAFGLAIGVVFTAMGAGAPGGGPGMKGPGGAGPGMKAPGGQNEQVPAATGSGDTQDQDKPGPRPGGPPAVDRDLEKAMGKALTDDQKKQIAEAMKTMHDAIQAAREAFVQQLAKITGLTVDQVRQALPPPPPPGGPRGHGGQRGQGGPGGPGGQGDGPPPPPPPSSQGAAK